MEVYDDENGPKRRILAISKFFSFPFHFSIYFNYYIDTKYSDKISRSCDQPLRSYRNFGRYWLDLVSRYEFSFVSFNSFFGSRLV
jgi:hypothetical protein